MEKVFLIMKDIKSNKVVRQVDCESFFMFAENS